MELIKPIVKERIAKMDQLGDTWEDAPVRTHILIEVSVIQAMEKQNDMLMWLMSEAKEAERSLEVLARRLLIVNLPALHTTSNVWRRLLSLQVWAPTYP